MELKRTHFARKYKITILLEWLEEKKLSIIITYKISSFSLPHKVWCKLKQIKCNLHTDYISLQNIHIILWRVDLSSCIQGGPKKSL